jgi:CRISPR-associated endonuclease/helicase Cas3
MKNISYETLALYARKTGSPPNIRWQTLVEHAHNVADLAKSFDVIGLEKTIYLTALLHDIGKATNEFQTYLENDGTKGDVKHSAPSAKVVIEYLTQNKVCEFFIEAIALCITAHHSGLHNGLSTDGRSEFKGYIDGDIAVNNKTQFNDSHKAKLNLVLSELFPAYLIEYVNKEIAAFLKRIKSVQDAPFMLNMVVRYIFSCLVDADREDARRFEDSTENPQPNFDELINKLEEWLKALNKAFNNVSTLNKYRQEVSNACVEASKKDVGIYKLEVPTGGGKTLASLRFALNHIKKKKLDRVIYIVPFLSIIEQTAQTLRNTLDISDDSALILEHHSNYIPSDNGVDEEKYRYMESRWNNPIIITTAVQFLESIFSNKAGVQRKFHNMANSVIIFDEIQSLPPKTYHLFNAVANFLSQFCNSTILLCSATQIPLNKIARPISIKEDLISSVATALPVRTKIVPLINVGNSSLIKEYSCCDLAGEILNKRENTLVIVNTKKDALNLFNELKTKKNDNSNLNLFYLSTNMCAKHRFDTINNIKTSLADNKKITVCISTQLIEAGVDVSFDCVYRALAGLDSIIQAAGRCNRNGELQCEKEVYVIKIKDSNLSKLLEIKQAGEITEALLSDANCKVDLLSTYSINKYYEQVLEKNKNNFDYQIENATLFDLHSLNNKGLTAFQNINGNLVVPPFLRCAYKTIGEEFYLIDKNGTTVYVSYNDEARELIKRFDNSERTRELFTKLSKYSVNLFQWQVDKLNGNITIKDNFYFLYERCYNNEVGIITNSDDLLLV